MDKIFVLNDGKISDSGSYQDLIQKSGCFKNVLLQNMAFMHQNDFKDIKIDLKNVLGNAGYENMRRKSSILLTQKYVQPNTELLTEGRLAGRRYSTFLGSEIGGPKTNNILKRRVSLALKMLPVDISLALNLKHQEETHIYSKHKGSHDKKLENLGKEKIKQGKTGWDVYWFYLKSMNFLLMGLSVICMVAQQGLDLTSNFWLSRWSEDKMSSSPSVRNYYLAMYGGTGAVAGVLLMSAFFTFALGGLIASQTIHNRILSKVLGASITFFEDSSKGMVMSRFSKDIETLDKKVSLGFQLTIMNTLHGKLECKCYI